MQWTRDELDMYPFLKKLKNHMHACATCMFGPFTLSNSSLMVKKVIPLFHSTIPFQWNIPLIQYRQLTTNLQSTVGFCRTFATRFLQPVLYDKAVLLYCSRRPLHYFFQIRNSQSLAVLLQRFCKTLYQKRHACPLLSLGNLSPSGNANPAMVPAAH